MDNRTDILFADFGIRQLHGRYVDAVWRQDGAAFADCFTEDAEWLIAGLHARGRAQAVENFGRLVGPAARVLMLLGMPTLDIAADGRSATGRINVTEILKRRDGEGARTLGVYYDSYAAGADGRWRFARRQWQRFYYGAADFSGPLDEGLDYGAPPAMPAAESPA